MQRGASLPSLGDFNQRVVLDAIRRRPQGVTRVDLAAVTGLSGQTVSNVTRRLLDSGLVRELGRRAAGPGKPATVLGLNETGLHSIGIHLDPACVDLALLDFGGAVVDTASEWLPADATTDDVLDWMASSALELCQRHGVAADSVLGVGLGAPGPLDLETGTMLDAPLLPQWRGMNLVGELEQRFGLPVALEKDVTAAAVGEAWLAGLEPVDNLLYVYWGTGIGVGLVERGTVLGGSTHNFGEAGHLVVSGRGAPCPCCGMVGTWGRTLAPHGMVDWAQQLGLVGEVVRGYREDTETLTGLLASDQTSGVRDFVDHITADLARGIGLLTDLLDCDVAVVGGHIWEIFAPAIQTQLASRVNAMTSLRSARDVTLRPSGRATGVVAVGAASLVLDQQFGPRTLGRHGEDLASMPAVATA